MKKKITLAESRFEKIIFASQNKGKIVEVKQILNGLKIELLSLLDFENIPEIIENGKTFEENAKIKAVRTNEKFNLPSIGDDSGLVVEQLNGEPGIYSARYSGENATDEKNNKKLINELKNFDEPHRAKFVCTAVYFDGKNYLKADGELRGRIIKQPKGKKGFGYDPHFIPDSYSKTTAEMNLDEKNKISHRAKAFNQLKDILKEKMEIV